MIRFKNLFLLIVELSGEELLLVLVAVSATVVVFVKILRPGTVNGLFTAPKTGAGLGCKVKRKKGQNVSTATTHLL